MDNKQISADELLAKLKENLGDEFTDSTYTPKKYKFSKSKKDEPADDTEYEKTLNDISELFESPVPKSEISDLDEDALMKMYLSPEDYKFLSEKKAISDEELMSTLDDLFDDEKPESKEYEVPDADLYNELNKDGKVCDVPEIGVGDSKKEDEEKTTVAKINSDGETISVEELGRFLAGIGKNEDATEEADGFDSFDDMPIIPVAVPEPEKGEEPEKADAAEKTEENISGETIFVNLPAVADNTAEDTSDAHLFDMDDTLESTSDGTTGEFEATEDKLPVDDTDVNIMLAFGMDEELDNALGKDKAEKMRSRNESDAEKMTAEADNGDDDEKPREFTSLSEAKELAEEYKKTFARNAISMFGVIIVSVVLFFYENLVAMGGKLPDGFNPEFFPVVNTMVGLQLLFISFIFALPYFKRGIEALIERKPTVDSLIPVIATASILYSLLSSLFVAGTTFPVFFFPASLAVLFVVINRRFEIRRETIAFGIASSKRIKFVLEKLDLNNSRLEKDTFSEYLPESPEIFKIAKTNFVENFFARTREYPTVKLLLNLLMAGMGGAAFIGFIVGFIKTGVWTGAVSVAYTAFSFCLPASLFLCFSLPSLHGQKNARADGSAFIGEAVIDNYTSAASISFDDREVFPTSGVKLSTIKMFRDEGRIDNAISYMASVYSRIGGPLSDVLNIATADLPKANAVEIISVEGDGVEAAVDKHHIYIGKAGYIGRKGYPFDADPDDDDLEAGNTAVTYLVLDDEVYAKMYVRYAIDPEFEAIVKTLYNSGICVGIKTLDPNINDSMLSARIQLDKYPVRVLKYSSVEELPATSKGVDSGIVSKKSAKALLRTFTLCDKIKHVTKTNIVISAIAMVIGLLITLAVAVFGNINSVFSVYVALYQLFWLLPAYGAVKLLMI